MTTKRELERAIKIMAEKAEEQGLFDCWEIDCPKRKKQATTCFAPHKPTCIKYISAHFIAEAKKKGRG